MSDIQHGLSQQNHDSPAKVQKRINEFSLPSASDESLSNEDKLELAKLKKRSNPWFFSTAMKTQFHVLNEVAQQQVVTRKRLTAKQKNGKGNVSTKTSESGAQFQSSSIS